MRHRGFKKSVGLLFTCLNKRKFKKKVKDIYNNEKKYKYWLEEVAEYGIDGISKKNSDMIIQYVKDMEVGNNIAKGSKRGARRYVYIIIDHYNNSNTLRNRVFLV